jgi:prepilin-type N-terminal cleavage/methylation domain-containing protein
MRRPTRDAGFTITELLVVVLVLSVVAAVALSRVRWGQQDTQTWADVISRTLAAARLRAVSGRQWYRVTIGASQLTTEYAPQRTDGGLPGVFPTNCADTTAGVWAPDPSLTRTAPREAIVWKGTAAVGAPTAPQTVDLKVCFRPDFTQVVRVGSDATNYLNAYVYVSAPLGVKGWSHRVALEGVGVVNVTNPW